MENDLMERLLTDFNGVLEEFNQLVRNNDFDGVKRVLDEVNRLVQERSGIVLDDREDPQYDHVLHEILDKMEGVVEREITAQGIDGVPGSRYYTNEQVQQMIDEAEAEIRRLSDLMRETEGFNDEAFATARSNRSDLIRRVADLRAALVEGQEFSTLTFVDPALAELQEARARLVEERNNNLAEIERLRAEEHPGQAARPEDQPRVDEINSRIAELERTISGYQSNINDIRGTSISQIIAGLRAQADRRAELEARRPDLQNQLRVAADRVRETRGFDEQNAQAQADYNAVVVELNNLDSELNGLEPANSKIETLESFLPETQETENVLDPQDYTYMGRLSDEQIIRRLLSEQLHLSDEEIEATIGEYSLVQADDEARDENGEDNPISMRQLVRTRTVRGDITVGEVIDNLETELYEEPTVDHSQEIEDIDNRIAELDETIRNATSRIEEINGLQLSDLINQRSRNSQVAELEARRTDLQNQLRAAADRVRETRGFDEQNAQAQADYNAIVNELNNLDEQLNSARQNSGDVEFLESFLPETQETENVLDPQDYTYMGRLSDEQIIRRLLSEQLHLSNEEIEATIGEYSLVQADDGARDENGEDNPISMRQLVRTRTVRGDISVTEVLNGLTQNIEQLEARRAELQAQLRAAADRIRETRGFDEQNAQAHADYNAIAQQISEIESQIASAQERLSRFETESGLKEQRDLIDSSKREQEELRAKKEELEKESAKKERPEVRAKLDALKEATGIAALESLMQKARDEKAALEAERASLVPGNGEPGKPGVDNSQKIADLEARNKEIDAKIAELDEKIGQFKGAVPPSKTTERLDVAEEAHKIGDHIFKTAKIRRELAERQVSRDEFLAFYQAGLDKTNEQIDELGQEYQKIRQEIKTVIVDTTVGKRIDKQIDEAEQAGNTELTISLYEKLRQNFITAGREEQLKQLGLNHEVVSDEDVKKMKEFFAVYKTDTTKALKDISDSVAELKENSYIFTTEIARIQAEKATIELSGESLDELQAKTNIRKDLRRRLLEASITPEKDLTDEQKELLEEWQKTSERFLDKKTTAKYVYINKDGEQVAIDVDTIDDTYPEYAKDIEFLGIPAYKENLEQISAYNQTHDPYVFGEEVARAYEQAEAEREGAGEEALARIIADKQKYVETFNGIPNPHKVKYENWKTSGSTLKGMKPVSRDLPATTRAKNVLENVGRFLGIRVPKFTRLDEHGNEVKDVKGGVTTLALDGLVVGAVVGSAVTIGPALAVAGYAAKGLVTVGNKVAARIEYARHKDEIDSNKPVLHQAGNDAREVARKEYYREQGDNRFVSWVKAKSDKYFTRKRGKETEQAIVESLSAQYDEAEDARTQTLKENLEIAQANQEARLKRQRQIAMGANTYNDIVRDPDAIDMDEATATIARNAALESVKQGSGREDVNKGSQQARKDQYVKQEEPVEKTADLADVSELADVEGPVSAITAEQIYTGRKQHVDRLNRVLTAITTGALKFGYTAWKEGLTKTEIIHHDAETKTDTVRHEEQIIHHDAEVKEVEVPDVQTQYDTSKTLGELQQNYAGKTATEYYSVSGGLRGARTEPLVDKGITAGWFDNKTAWGTGISDTQGLSAPVLTDRLAGSSLLDPSGMIRSDATVKEFLDAMGCTNPDLTNLQGIYMSVGDKYWVSLADLMKGLTKEVTIGSHTETQVIKEAFDQVIPAWDEPIVTVLKEAWDETKTTFDPAIVAQAVKDGLLVGAGMGVVDSLHEAAQNTYIDGATPGRPEETMPRAKYSFDDMADELLDQAETEKQENERVAEEKRKKEEKKKNREEHEEDGQDL